MRSCDKESGVVTIKQSLKHGCDLDELLKNFYNVLLFSLLCLYTRALKTIIYCENNKIV